MKQHSREHYKFYIISGVSETAKFCPLSQYEITEIGWKKIENLPLFPAQKAKSGKEIYLMIGPVRERLMKYIAHFQAKSLEALPDIREPATFNERKFKDSSCKYVISKIPYSLASSFSIPPYYGSSTHPPSKKLVLNKCKSVSFFKSLMENSASPNLPPPFHYDAKEYVDNEGFPDNFDTHSYHQDSVQYVSDINDDSMGSL